MLINELSKLFVYVPLGYGQQFIDNYATAEEYKQKIVFVADTHQIFTNGEFFGVSAPEFTQIINGLVERIEALEGDGDAPIERITNLEEAMAIVNGDENTEGSIAKAVNDLKESILGGIDDIDAALDTIAEIDKWIKDHEVDFEALMTNLDSVNDKLDNEIERATMAENDLEQRVKNIEDISIWDTFTPVSASSTSDIDSIADPENTDLSVDTQDATNYFSDNANANTVFKNITI